MKIALISCSKNKKEIECKARDMYSKSPLFNKSFEYCLRQQYNLIFILSAKYGVLKPTDIISAYEKTLNTFTKSQKIDWGKSCANQLHEFNKIENTFDFYCGKNYYMILSKYLINTANILQGLGIGQRLRFLK